MNIPRLLALALCLAAAALLAAQETHPKPISNAAFDRLATLAGNWQGKYTGPAGTMMTTAKFKVVSAGSAVMLSMDEGKDGEMITMFHPDGHTALMATHYCSGQNQPRMKMVAMPDPNKLVFDFVDGTNVEGEHMKKLVITFVDKDTHIEEWTSVADGKQQTAKFEMHRAKS